MTLPAVIAALKSRLEGVPGILTVFDVPPETDPDPSLLPLIVIDVGAPSTDTTSHRRTIHWPIDLVLLAAKRDGDIATELPIAYPYPEAIVGQLDGQITLNGLLAGGMKWADPMMDQFSVIGWRQATYVGCVLHPIFPIKIERYFAP